MWYLKHFSYLNMYNKIQPVFGFDTERLIRFMGFTLNYWFMFYTHKSIQISWY